MTAWTDPDDPFGTLARVPDGIVLPELSLALFDRRDNIAETLPWVRNLVAASGLCEWFEERIAERKKVLNPDTRAGCPRAVTVEAVLVAWFLGKMTRNSFLHTETARFLLSTLTDSQRTSLGVPLVRRNPTAKPMSADTRTRLDKDAVGKRISRLSAQMDWLINPSEFNQPRSRIKTVDKESLRRTDVTPAELADAQARLDWVALQIMSLPIKMMPRWLRRQYKGDGCVDDTPIRLASSTQNTERVAWDVTGGAYIRTKPTSDRDARKTSVAKAKGKAKAKVIKTPYQAHDAALVIACDATPGPHQYFPTIPIGVTLHAASTDPAGNSKRVFDLLATTGITKRHMGADRLYPWQLPSKFHLPLIEHGWGLIFDYRIDTLGRQGFAPDGPLLIEGQFHCPMTPEAAIEATRDLREETIDHDTYEARMAVRALHRMHERASPTTTARSASPAPHQATPRRSGAPSRRSPSSRTSSPSPTAARATPAPWSSFSRPASRTPPPTRPRPKPRTEPGPTEPTTRRSRPPARPPPGPPAPTTSSPRSVAAASASSARPSSSTASRRSTAATTTRRSCGQSATARKAFTASPRTTPRKQSAHRACAASAACPHKPCSQPSASPSPRSARSSRSSATCSRTRMAGTSSTARPDLAAKTSRSGKAADTRTTTPTTGPPTGSTTSPTPPDPRQQSHPSSHTPATPSSRLATANAAHRHARTMTPAPS